MVVAVIPTLHEKTATTFDTLGLGALPSWIEGDVEVVEERNGEFYLQGTLPADGLNVNKLAIERIILAAPAPGKPAQPFRVQDIKKDSASNTVEIYAPHISCQLAQTGVLPVDDDTPTQFATAQAAMDDLWTHCKPTLTGTFTPYSDITPAAPKAFVISEPASVRSALGGVEGSIIDVFGGELEFDGWTVNLLSARGQVTSKVVRYGVNMESLESDTDAQTLVTAMIGYVKYNGFTISGDLVYLNGHNSFAYPRVEMIDFTEEFSNAEFLATTQEITDLTTAAAAGKTAALKTSITITAVPEELQDVYLCDTVTVLYPGYNVQQTSKVVRVVFDPIKEVYKEITIGEIQQSITDTIAQLLMDDKNKSNSGLASMQSSMNWRWIQDRIRQEGVSTLPLDVPRDGNGDPTNCDILKGNSTPWVYSSYKPQAIYSWARKIINISGALKMKISVNATTDDYITILTGLPTLISTSGVAQQPLYNAIEVHPPSGQDFTVDGLYTTEQFVRVYYETELADYVNDSSILYAFVADTAEHWTKVNGAWVRRYTPSGVLQINYVDNKTRNSSFNIPVNSIITISTQPYSLAMRAGAIIFPRIYPRDIERVSTWIKAHRGVYDYVNNGRWRRRLADDQANGLGATDCSGMIYSAFRYGAGKSVPDGTKVMIGYGKVVAFARAGEELDTSLLREGDIVGWITATASTRIGACHHVGIVVKGMPGDASDTKLRIWHQTTTFICYTQEAAEGDTDKSHDVIPTYQSYIHQSVVAEAEGETKRIVYGPQPVASQPYGNPEQMSVSRSDGKVYTDANYGMGGARIVVRWAADSDNLRVPDMNFDVDNIPPDDEAN